MDSNLEHDADSQSPASDPVLREPVLCNLKILFIRNSEYFLCLGLKLYLVTVEVEIQEAKNKILL